MTLEYDIPPRPMKYRGIQYRSKLKATWAAFFDICDWRFEYEPETFGEWMPDFALYGEDGKVVLVEVKPITKPDSDICMKMIGNRPSKDTDLLLLGVSPFSVPEDGIRPFCDRGETGATVYAIGWLGETPTEGSEEEVEEDYRRQVTQWSDTFDPAKLKGLLEDYRLCVREGTWDEAGFGIPVDARWDFSDPENHQENLERKLTDSRFGYDFCNIHWLARLSNYHTKYWYERDAQAMWAEAKNRLQV